MKKALCLVAMAMVLSSIAPVLAEGILYTDSTIPSSIDLQTRESSKCGAATCYNVLDLVEWGNCGINAAMRNGRIKQVHHSDTNTTGWIFFKKVTTQVYGE